MQKTERAKFVLYSISLAAGAALLGVVFGFLVRQPTAQTATIIVLVGVLLLAIAVVVLAWDGKKGHPSGKRK